MDFWRLWDLGDGGFDVVSDGIVLEFFWGIGFDGT